MVNHFLTSNEQPDIESSTPGYARRFSGQTGKWFLSIQCQALKSAIYNDVNEIYSVLDVGGGHGQDVGVITELGHQLTVLGSNESCFQMIRSLENELVKFEKGSLIKLPYQDKAFDICVSFRMLPHLDHWQAHIKELCRVSLKKVVVDFPTKRSVNIFSQLLFPLKKGIEKNTRPYTLFSENEIIEIFRQNGFQLYQRNPEFFFPMALHRIIKNVPVSRALEFIAKALGLNYFFGSPIICSFIKMEN